MNQVYIIQITEEIVNFWNALYINTTGTHAFLHNTSWTEEKSYIKVQKKATQYVDPFKLE